MAHLTAAQLTTLKNDIAALMASGQPLNAYAGTSAGDGDANTAIAAYYNVTASPDFIVWRDLPMETLLSLLVPANMTPVDAVPTFTNLPSNPTSAQNATFNNQIASSWLWGNRMEVCKSKQFSLSLLINRDDAPMKQTAYRAGLQDALTNLPAGASGAMLSAGWVSVRDAAKFMANRIEKLLSTGTGSLASPADLPANHEGTITLSDVEAARTQA